MKKDIKTIKKDLANILKNLKDDSLSEKEKQQEIKRAFAYADELKKDEKYNKLVSLALVLALKTLRGNNE